jgi:hypothetical protein
VVLFGQGQRRGAALANIDGLIAREG